MKFYTVQKRCTWNRWKKQGYLEAYNFNFDEFFEIPYKWMMEQMEKHLPNYKGEIPIWLWVDKPEWYRKWSSIPRKKFVLLTIEVDEKDVLLSNFHAWHIPLSGDLFDNDEPWERVFDIEWCKSNDFEVEGKGPVFQGVTGRIDLDKVQDVKFFTARNG